MDTVANHPLQAAAILLNFVSACGIVFANKAVFSLCGYQFTVTLTCIHTIFSYLVAKALRLYGAIQPKDIPRSAVVSLALAFAGYIVLCNVSLALNTVGFYQLLKIAGAPTMMFMEAFSQKRLPKLDVAICVFITCVGIGIATVTDSQVMTNLPGLIVGVGSVLVTSQYGIWIGSMCKFHEVTALQLLDQYLPCASSVMAVCALGFSVLGDRIGSLHYGLSCELSTRSAAIVGFSAVLGAMVTFTTFLVINFTSALTYSVVGHVKTIAILVGGVVFFNDQTTAAKTFGTALALAGVIAYTHVKTLDKGEHMRGK